MTGKTTMAMLELLFESKEVAFSPRRFQVAESISDLFSVSVWARCENPDVDMETLIGKKAEFTVQDGLAFVQGDQSRKFTGICENIEQVETESTGLSMYYVHIVPTLWLLTKRTNHRLFQHLSIPDIVTKLLKEWQVEHEWRIDKAQHPQLELRIQYGETDFAFVSRLLEETGICYYFITDPKKGSVLVLSDAPETAEARSAALPFVDNPSIAAQQHYVTEVRVARSVRPGKVSVRDYDLRRGPGYALWGVTEPKKKPEEKSGNAKEGGGSQPGIEEKLERARFAPNVAKVEQPVASKTASPAPAAPKDGDKPPAGALDRFSGQAGTGAAPGVGGKIASQVATGKNPEGGTPVADDQGIARYEDAHAKHKATVELESRRSLAYEIQCATNAIDVRAGMVLSVVNHPMAEVGKKLLVLGVRHECKFDGGFHHTLQLVPGDQPYRPARKTARPVVSGMQSAVVVGPAGEEIYTDEFGRVRVQFHWDREGKYDEKTSCWLRVSQRWAGPGYGMMTTPRIGHEVLVGFADGNPDEPIVLGSMYSTTMPVPHTLAQHKARSTWRTNSSPGRDGTTEFMMDDSKGKELVYVQGERDFQGVIKNDRAAKTGRNDQSVIGEKYVAHMARSATGVEMVKGRITFFTPGASMTLEGGNAYLHAKGGISIASSGDNVILNGGPNIKINCGGHDLKLPPPMKGGGGPPAPGAKPAHAPAPAPAKKPAKAEPDKPDASPAPTTPAGKATAGTLPNGKKYVAYDNQVKVGGSRAWRNNNPGNIEYGKFAKAHGAIGSDGRFAIFPDEATGKEAIKDLMQTKNYKDLSVTDAVHRYAPSFENDTGAYINAVTKDANIDASSTIGSLSDGQLDAVANAIQRHEGWIKGSSYLPGDQAAPDAVKALFGGG